MPRMIYKVDAFIVDANGTYSQIQGYPKTLDSRGYGNDPQRAFRRAKSDLCATEAQMLQVDTRQIQTILLMDIYGNVLIKESYGEFPEEVTV